MEERLLLLQVRELIIPLRRVKGIFYGWWMAGVGAIIMALGTVPLFQGLPVWNPALRSYFGWTASQVTWAFAFTRVEGGLLGPLEGFLIDRLGSRRMVLIGIMILGGGFLLFSQVNELWHLYIAFMLMSFGAALGTWLPMMTAINHWFVRRRSLAMSLVMEGFALGGIAIPLVLAWAVGAIGGDQPGGDRFGWRTTAAGIGVALMLLAFPLSRLVHNRPEDLGLHPDGGTAPPIPVRGVRAKASQPAEEERGLTWREAIRTRVFWLMSIGHACSSIVIVTIMTQLGLLLDDRGFSLQTISLIVALYTAINALFILIGGYLGDRMPIRLAVFGFSAIQSVAVIVILFAHSLPMLFLFAVLLGIGFGGRTPLTTSMRGVYFGRKAFASITGVSMVPMNVLLFSAPLFAGYMRDITGSYNIPFITVAIVSLFGSFLFLLLGEPRPLSSPRVVVAPSSGAR
jgi:MFS family permease